MIGHEGVRRLTEAHLAAHLPAKLDQIRAQTPPVPVDNAPDVWPPNPKVFCSDVVPTRSDLLPAVMVGSSQLLSLQACEGGAAAEWQGRYQFDVNAVCVSPHAGGDVLAGIGRDRLVLAVREILIEYPDAGGGVRLLCRDLVEDTGPVGQDDASRPKGGGVTTVQADTVETLNGHSWPVTDLTIDTAAAGPRETLT